MKVISIITKTVVRDPQTDQDKRNIVQQIYKHLSLQDSLLMLGVASLFRLVPALSLFGKYVNLHW